MASPTFLSTSMPVNLCNSCTAISHVPWEYFKHQHLPQGVDRECAPAIEFVPLELLLREPCERVRWPGREHLWAPRVQPFVLWIGDHLELDALRSSLLGFHHPWTMVIIAQPRTLR
eukprot:TRINITY_DN2977_c0_g1_i4.p2 TRINITY_DN2977_c0_g1~~TRINITY_DN2977_c0_g1_i4.p2  ORF type:complete len:116 (-),score=6.26 TRINITY_DN2977_c0_g1_i4:197-544(-)